MNIVVIEENQFLHDKLNIALNLALLINSRIGQNPLFELESPLTLCRKIRDVHKFSERSHQNNSLKIFFQHPIWRSEIWQEFNVPKAVLDSISPRFPCRDKEELIDGLNSLIDQMSCSNRIMKLYIDRIIKFSSCQHTIDEHLDDLMSYLCFLVTDYRVQGFSLKAVESLLRDDLFQSKRIIPPTEIILQYGTDGYDKALEDYRNSATLRTQLDSLFHRYDYPMERYRYFSRLENVQLPKQIDRSIAIRYNDISFITSDHNLIDGFRVALEADEYSFFDDDYISAHSVYVTYYLDYKVELKNNDNILEALSLALLWFNNRMNTNAHLSPHFMLISQDSNSKLKAFQHNYNEIISMIDWRESKGLSHKNAYENNTINDKLNIAITLGNHSYFYDAVNHTTSYKTIFPDNGKLNLKPKWTIKDRVLSDLKHNLKHQVWRSYSDKGEYNRADILDDDNFLIEIDNIENDPGLSFLLKYYLDLVNDNISIRYNDNLQRSVLDLKVFRDLHVHANVEQSEIKAKLKLFLPRYYQYVNDIIIG